MYAVIETGGKQYRVNEGDVVRIEKLAADVGSEVSFDRILMVGEGSDLKVGTPLVDGAKVRAKIVEQDRHRKIIVFKMKRRKNYRRKQGHRQDYTGVRIEKIEI
ncbi:MAG: 50S ribosomal protein L21 [Deltaproteobacteria bacterium]|nr:50S ribosomal protein L21 [Deltaproteobacteria bacterium]